ncbi:Uncharacterised protein [Yersinia mollaretii]|nr:Uncharacterised protein [Yersinia mollaretii]
MAPGLSLPYLLSYSLTKKHPLYSSHPLTLKNANHAALFFVFMLS